MDRPAWRDGYNGPAVPRVNRAASILIQVGSRVMIEVEHRGAVSVLRMARGKGNSLNLDLLSALAEKLDSLERGSAARRS